MTTTFTKISAIAISLAGLISAPLSALAQPITAPAHKGSQAQALLFTKDNNAVIPAVDWLWVSEKTGLMLQSMPNADKTSLPAAKTLVKGEFELLAFSDPYALTLDRRADRIRPIMIKQIEGKVATNVLPLLPMASFEINWICIQPRPQDGNIYAWFGGEDGYSEQWLLGDAGHFMPKKLRSQAIPVNSTSCAIDGDKLLVSEPEAGVWQFDASPFADNSAKLVLAALNNDIAGMQVIDGKLLLSDKKGTLTLDQQPIANYNLGKVQGFSGYLNGTGTNRAIQFALYDDKTDQYLFTQAVLPAALTKASSKPSDNIIEIPAWVESAPSDRPGDTMDDPAIWVHPTEPEKKPSTWHQQTLGAIEL